MTFPGATFFDLRAQDVALWRIDLSAAGWANFYSVLSDAEVERGGRFVTDTLRRRYFAAHAAMRLLLGQHLNLDPKRLVFDEGRYGKPGLMGIGCAFNLSHSDDIGALAISLTGRPIGLDVEALAPVHEMLMTARRVFTVSEIDTLEAAEQAQKEVVFLRGWTRKEACVKAVGSGLQIEPDTFEAGLEPTPREVRIPFEGKLHVLQVASVDLGAGAVAAIACGQ